jgi:predicted Zn-dependent protease
MAMPRRSQSAGGSTSADPGRGASVLSRFVVGAAAVMAASVLSAPPAAAAEGFYGPVEVRKNEASLMKTVSEYEEMFARRGYRYNAPEVEELVARLGARLALPPTDDYIRYRFHILRDPEPNAFALPDGQVYFNTGLLALLENEAQIAAILAHEVHHTAGHHGILEYRSMRAKSITSMAIGPMLFGIADIFLALSVFGYSRDLEEEADRKGAARMLEAGYDPRQVSRVFEILLEDPEEEEPKRSTAWSTHPQLQARAEYCRTLASDLISGAGERPLRTAQDEYRRLVRRVSLETVQDLIAVDYPRSAHALASRLLSEDPVDPARHLALADATRALGARQLKAGEAEEATDKEKKQNVKVRTKLTRAEREAARLATPEGKKTQAANLEAARRSYLKALELDANLAEAHRGLGLTLLEQDDLENAGRELVIYLRARPDAADKPVIMARLKDLTERIKKKGNADEASPTQ